MVLSTVWDSEAEASQFATAMSSWLDEGDDVGAVLGPEGTNVQVLFASDEATLETLRTAA